METPLFKESPTGSERDTWSRSRGREAVNILPLPPTPRQGRGGAGMERAGSFGGQCPPLWAVLSQGLPGARDLDEPPRKAYLEARSSGHPIRAQPRGRRPSRGVFLFQSPE